MGKEQPLDFLASQGTFSNFCSGIFDNLHGSSGLQTIFRDLLTMHLALELQQSTLVGMQRTGPGLSAEESETLS